MKKLLFILLFFSIAIATNAQFSGMYKDTVITTSTTYSEYYYPPTRGANVKGAGSATSSRQFNEEKDLFITGRADSIGTGATILWHQVLEYGAYANGSTIWIPHDSVIVSNATLDAGHKLYWSFLDTTYEGAQWRLHNWAATSTQNVKSWNEWCVKPK